MSIRRNTFYNLAGSLLPLAVSLLTVPVYLQIIGEERYGVLAIVWLLLGYFGLFDLGLSRATSNQIAKMRVATSAQRQEVFWTALGLNVCFGLVGGIVLYGIATPILVHFFKMSNALRAEVLLTLPWIAMAIPLATVSGVLTGTLEGRERFAIVNTIEVIGTVLLQVIPLLVVFLRGPELDFLIPATVLTRAVAVPLLFISVAIYLPLGKTVGFSRQLLKTLLSYGGWVTITTLIATILETIDRFFIGIVLGARAVAYYSVPFNLVSRLRIIPGALARSIFPVFSRLDNKESNDLAIRSIGILVAILTPLTVVGIFAMAPFLALWLGKDFASHAAPLGETLLVGIWMNSLAYIPFALLEGKGRPDLLTKLHLFTLPFFLGFLWMGARWFGLDGIAIAWSARVWLDSNILLVIAGLWSRCWLVISPGALFILLALIAAKFSSFTFVPAIALILASVGWTWRNEPRLRQVVSNLKSRIIRNVLRK